MEIVKENFHPSFFKGNEVKSVFEFELPEDQIAHYDALNGHLYKKVLHEFIAEKSAVARQFTGMPEGEQASKDIARIEYLAQAFEVLIYRG